MDERGRTVEVTIFGEMYRLKSTREPEYLRLLARMVDDAMKEVAENIPRLGISRVAVMAALNLASSLVEAKKRNDQLASMLEKQLGQIEAAAGKEVPGPCPGSG